MNCGVVEFCYSNFKRTLFICYGQILLVICNGNKYWSNFHFYFKKISLLTVMPGEPLLIKVKVELLICYICHSYFEPSNLREVYMHFEKLRVMYNVQFVHSILHFCSRRFVADTGTVVLYYYISFHLDLFSLIHNYI